jgi:REP element-mobilizing transposase RayT
MDIVRDDYDRTAFVRLMRGSAADFEWRLHAYCLMTNHFHFVVEAVTIQLSAGMQVLNWSLARRFNERYERFGHLFESRFRARLVERDEHLRNACEYVRNNPVAVGLVERADDWPWSGGLYA